MLHITVGRAGTGKTYSMFGKIKELVESGKGDICLLVPDQFSFEAEGIILKLCGALSSNSVEVYGFSRLCEEILKKFGGLGGVNINDAAKAVLLKQAANSVKDELKVYSKICEKNEFIHELLYTITELKQADIDIVANDFCENGSNDALTLKLNDIKLISDAYSALIENVYVDTNDLVNKAYEKAKGNGWFRNKTFFIDSFSGFTGAQLKLLEVALSEADDVYINFTCNNDDYYSDDYTVFSAIKKEVRKIIAITQKNGIKVDKTVVLPERQEKPKDLSILERVVSGASADDYTENSDNITVCHGNTLYDEAEFVAKEIRRLVRECGYRFRDFVVVSGNGTDYEKIICDAMHKYSVPCFIDKRIDANNIVLPLFVLAVLKCSVKPSSENILNMLKTGLSGMPEDDICELENYVYIWGYNSLDWETEWTLSPNGYEKSFESADATKQKLNKLNELRCKAVAIFSDIRFNSKVLATEIINRIFNMLKSKISPVLSAYTDKLANDGELYLASVEADSWELVMQALDCMQLCFGERKVGIEEFYDAFEVYISNSSVGETPQTLDEVVFGVVDRIRPKYPKVTFLVGVNQGVFPNYSKTSGVLSQRDRQRLIDNGAQIEDRSIDSAIMENFRFYSVVSGASERVYFTCSSTGRDGSSADMSRVLRRVTEKMPHINITYESYNAPICENDVESAIPSFERASYCWNENNVVINSLKSVFENDDFFNEKIKRLNANNHRDNCSISPESANALYKGHLKLSASKVDDYYRCPFMFFCKFGLSAKKLKKAELSSVIRGTIVHFVLEYVIDNNKHRLGQLNDVEIKSGVDSACEEYFKEINIDETSLPPSFIYSLLSTKKMLSDLIGHINKEFAQSGFKVDSCELSVSKDGPVKPLEIPLSNGEVLPLQGSVDRVDICEIDGANYVRVVDYKTGGKAFKLCDTLAGLNLQMLIYLYAIVKGYGKELDPAGIMYLMAKGGIPNAGEATDKEFKANGLFTNDLSVLRMMENDLAGKFIPAKLNSKTPTLSKRSQVVSSEAFNLIFKNIDKLLENMGNEVFEGDISVNPTNSCDSDACKYCDFREICLRDATCKNNQVDEISNQEAVEILKESNETIGEVEL